MIFRRQQTATDFGLGERNKNINVVFVGYLKSIAIYATNLKNLNSSPTYCLTNCNTIRMPCPILLTVFQHYFLVCAVLAPPCTCSLKLPPHVDPLPVNCCDVFPPYENRKLYNSMDVLMKTAYSYRNIH